MVLDALRKRSGSIVIKILFGLLILSFAAWGVGDMLRRGVSPDTVAEVGGVPIHPRTITEDYRRETAQLRQLLGGKFDAEQAKALGILDIVLERHITRTLFDLAVRDLKLSSSDALVLRAIQNDPNFKGIAGVFDKNVFRQILAQNGLNEDIYVNLLRGDLARRQLLKSIEGGAQPPAGLTEELARVRGEKRSAELALIAHANITGLPQPSDEQLIAFHKDNAQAFTAPEYRKLSFLNLTPGDLIDTIAVADADLASAYEERKAEFGVAEKRDLHQILFLDEASAKTAHERLAKGEDFGKVAKEVAGQDPGSLAIGKLAKTELLPEVAEPAFALAPGAYSAPIQSPLGWHILRVMGIEKGVQKTFDEVKNSLRDQLAKEKAIEALYKLVRKLEDELAGGATLEEVAQRLGLKSGKVEAVDAQGRALDGQPAAGLPAGETFLKTAFATSASADSQVTDNGDEGFFVVRVDNVTAPAVRPFAEVKDAVTQAWNLRERETKARDLAGAIQQAVKNGQGFAAAAGAYGFKVETAAAFPRQADAKSKGALSAEITDALFRAQVNEVVSAPGADGVYVAKLTAVHPFDPKADPTALKSVADELRAGLNGDLQAQFAAALRGVYKVRVNRAALDQIN